MLRIVTEISIMVASWFVIAILTISMVESAQLPEPPLTLGAPLVLTQSQLDGRELVPGLYIQPKLVKSNGLQYRGDQYPTGLYLEPIE